MLMSSIIDGHQFDAIVQADILLYWRCNLNCVKACS